MLSLCVPIRNAEISNFGHSNESNLPQRTPAQQKSNMQNCHPKIEKGGSLGFKLLFYNSLRDLAALDYEKLLALNGIRVTKVKLNQIDINTICANRGDREAITAFADTESFSNQNVSGRAGKSFSRAAGTQRWFTCVGKWFNDDHQLSGLHW